MSFKKVFNGILAVGIALAMVLPIAVPAFAADLTSVTNTPTDPTANATTTHTIAFTTATAGNITTIDIEFQAGFDVSGVTLVSNTGIGAGTVAAALQVVTYTVTSPAANVTASTAITVGLGTIVNHQTAATNYTVEVTTKDSGTPIDGPTTSAAFIINPGAINAYSVSTIASPQVAGVSFNVTIQAQDAYSNNITAGADASENITITFGKADASATPTSTTTANGTATVSMTMTVDQSGQSITFTGDTSGKTGTSNTFDVDPGAIDAYSVSTIASPQVAGVSFNVTIQAQDAYSSNITAGADASENITITFDKADASATPTSTTTANGTATVSMTMTVDQSGQSITFTGDTSGKTGTSNTFNVNPGATPPSEEEPEYREESEPPPKPAVGDVSDIVDEAGVFTRLFTFKSEDKQVNLSIPKGTTGKTKEDEPLSEITITKVKRPPDPSADTRFIGLTYNFEPDGATFDPPITLSFSYNPLWIPKEVGPENLTIAYWDEDAGEWVEFDAKDITIDTEKNTISAQISHFTYFSVIVYTRPAAFTVSDLTITPTEVDIAQSVTIGVTLNNTGDLSGSHDVTLKINNVVVSTKKVTMTGHAAEKVTFTTIQGIPASYAVNVNGLSGTFTVKPVPTEPIVVTSPPAPAPSVPAPVPAPAPPAPVPAAPPVPTTPWWLIAIIAVATIIAVGAVLWFFAFRQEH